MTITTSERVLTAIRDGSPVVALETSVLAHGLPEPWNRRAAGTVQEAVRSEGAEPAWIWLDRGAIRVGATEEEVEMLMAGGAAKVARRDLPMVLAGGAQGATTVSAALWAAHRAGIEVAATGGIGGVHPGTSDVSADLGELARTPGTLVCSGPKSIVDPAATAERLEELGVGVIGYRTDRLPFFLVRHTDLALEHRADDPKEVAAASATRRDLGIESALLVCNPCPEEAALPPDVVEDAVRRCIDLVGGIVGKSVTPRLLACLAEQTGGDSLRANLALLESNASLAAQIAVALV